MKELGMMLIVSVVLLVLTNKIPPLIGQIAMGGGTEALGNGAVQSQPFGLEPPLLLRLLLQAHHGSRGIGHDRWRTRCDDGILTSIRVRKWVWREMLAASSGGDSGGSALASAMGGDSGVSSQSNTGISQSGGASAGSNAKGSVAAKAARIASGTVSNLVQGALDVARDSAKGRVSETTGGKIAAAIEARGTTSNSGTNDGNSLSAGTGTSETSVTHHGILVNPQQPTGTSYSTHFARCSLTVIVFSSGKRLCSSTYLFAPKNTSYMSCNEGIEFDAYDRSIHAIVSYYWSNENVKLSPKNDSILFWTDGVCRDRLILCG